MRRQLTFSKDSKAIEGPSDDASGTWIKLKFVLEQVAFGTRIDPIQGAKYSTRVEQAAYSALNRRRDQSYHLKAE
ncbi:LOW QUALITY PROTEIN: hypothetical protein V1478_002427 [Vespula squamosa]|uniref:Uncharacterized protein n=1 Tax=Vespula squamosa TaxID=30214 RepID=A0ABD2BAC9_VESSQ